MKWSIALMLVFGVSACGGSDEPPAKKPAASTTPVPLGGAKAAAPAAAAPASSVAKTDQAQSEADVAPPPKVEFQDSDFSESERSRDPFRTFIDVFVEQNKAKVSSQLNVVAKQYTLEELKLVAIVTRIEPPRAMFVDPTGKGHVVDHGDFIGKAEIVQGGSGNADYEIHWRVDRVRDNDVVLVREDPTNPDVTTATRVIPLRVEDTLNEGL